MTIQDLKNNRELIIAKITELVGEENLAKIMQTMIGGLDCCDSIDELIESAIDICEFERFAKKDTGNRAILGKLEQLEIENN